MTMNKFNKISIFIVCTLFFINGNSQNVNKNDLLIPYYKNNKWGLSNIKKTVKIEPKFGELFYIPPYFLVDKNEKQDILDSNGKSISSDYLYVQAIGKDSYLFFKKAPTHIASNVSAYYNFAQYTTSYYLYKLENNKLTKLTEGTTDAFFKLSPYLNRKTSNLYVITQDDLMGIYDISKQKYLIDPKYKNIHIPEGNHIIAYNDSNNMEIKHINGSLLPKNKSYINKNIAQILDNGYYIVTPENESPKKYGNYKRDLQTPDGKTVIEGGLNMKVLTDIDMIQCQIESTIKGNEQLYNYYDLQGNLLLSEIREYKMSSPNLMAVFGKGYDNLVGLYNYKSRKMVWENDFPKTSKVKFYVNYDFGVTQIEVDTTFHYIDDKGKSLMNISGYRRYNSQYKKAKTLKITPQYNPEDPYKYKYLTALRDSEDKPFAIYDENYKKVENMQEFLGNSRTETYAFKEYDKWKLADFDGLVLPEQYDSITFTKTDYNFRLYKNGKSQIYLKKLKKLLPAYDYDDAIGYEHHNYYLGIKYLENLKRGQDYRFYKYLKCQVDLIDDKGNVIYSFVNTPEIGIKYALTKTNQIIEYPEDNKYFHFRVHDTKSKKIKNIKERILRFESYKDMPVLAVLGSDNIVDDKLRGLWNINKHEWIRNLSKESKTYQSHEIDFNNKKETLKTLSITEVTDNPDYWKNRSALFFEEPPQRFYNIIGYISIDGTFYAE